MLSELLSSVAADLNVPTESVYAWSDSAVVLGWINSSDKFRVYVSRRVQQITERLPAAQWRYVATNVNPAHLVSRGVAPDNLLSSSLWWQGSPWLKEDPRVWPRRPEINLSRELPELKVNNISIEANDLNRYSTLERFIERFSSMSSLVRTTAWIRRIAWNITHKGNPRKANCLSQEEIQEAEIVLIRQVQRNVYSTTINTLQEGKSLSKGSNLLSLSPIIGPQQLVRVGGRLSNAELSFLQKHPVILPRTSRLSLLLVRRVHLTSGHARTQKQMMGDLPAARVTPAPPFSVVGLDYAGPFQVKRGNPRHPTIIKAYACIYTCFITRAVHIEAVTDMTTEAFLACFIRFLNRRGCPAEIFSDNGGNFVGADRQLSEAHSMLHSEAVRLKLTHLCSERGIIWHFSPSRSPHHGGLWEAGVKSMKTLLRKVAGRHRLTYEELQTILTDAEATLNSRPIAAQDSMSPDGMVPLSSGHFIVGRPLRAPPMTVDLHSKLTPIKRWNLLKTLTADIWERWKSEYLQQRQTRSKWQQSTRNIRVGDVVLLMDESLTRRDWPMARVTKVYPGKDDRVRVADLKLASTTLRRPITKLVLLVPADPDSDQTDEVDAQQPQLVPHPEDVRASETLPD